MDITQHISLQVNKGDFEFTFHMPNGATWGNAIDAAFEVLQKLNDLSKKSVEAMKPAQPEINPDIMPEG